MEEIIYAQVEIDGKEVLLTAPRHLRQLVNKVNGRDIFGSRFYNDIANEEPYLNGPEFVFGEDMEKKYPAQYRYAMDYLIEKGVAKRDSSFLLTERAVINILYVYKIDPKTLLLGGEKIPVKQNSLFNGTPQTTTSTEANKVADILFPQVEVKRKSMKEGRLTRMHKPGVSIRDDKVDRLVNLSKPLMALLFKMPYIAQIMEVGGTTVQTDITVNEVGGVKFIGFRFHADGKYPMVLKRDPGDSIVGIQNIFIDKRCPEKLYKTLFRLLKTKKLLLKDFTNPEITRDIVFFRVED